MKKYLLLICLFMASSNTFAQKTYINVCYEQSRISLSGDIPTTMLEKYYHGDIGNILNKLSENGFEVEFMCNYKESTVNYLLSKKVSSYPNAVRGIELNEDEDVTEVARYNLQGLPVSKNEKGVQIIVYSNYTTKTVIVQ